MVIGLDLLLRARSLAACWISAGIERDSIELHDVSPPLGSFRRPSTRSLTIRIVRHFLGAKGQGRVTHYILHR